jgi:hypothetical protein
MGAADALRRRGGPPTPTSPHTPQPGARCAQVATVQRAASVGSLAPGGGLIKRQKVNRRQLVRSNFVVAVGPITVRPYSYTTSGELGSHSSPVCPTTEPVWLDLAALSRVPLPCPSLPAMLLIATATLAAPSPGRRCACSSTATLHSEVCTTQGASVPIVPRAALSKRPQARPHNAAVYRRQQALHDPRPHEPPPPTHPSVADT